LNTALSKLHGNEFVTLSLMENKSVLFKIRWYVASVSSVLSVLNKISCLCYKCDPKVRCLSLIHRVFGSNNGKIHVQIFSSQSEVITSGWDRISIK
jgi:hypothetical protein